MDHEVEIHNTITECMDCKVSIEIDVEVYDDETLYEESMSPEDEKKLEEFLNQHEGHDIEETINQ